MNIFNRLNRDLYFMTDTVVDWVDIFTLPTFRLAKFATGFTERCFGNSEYKHF